MTDIILAANIYFCHILRFFAEQHSVTTNKYLIIFHRDENL